MTFKLRDSSEVAVDKTFRETFIIDYRASVTRVNKEFDKVRDYK
jgi:hypothetical protein